MIRYRPDLGRGRFEHVGPARGDDYVRALSSHAGGGGLSDSFAPAGYDSYFSVESEIHVISPLISNLR